MNPTSYNERWDFSFYAALIIKGSKIAEIFTPKSPSKVILPLQCNPKQI